MVMWKEDLLEIDSLSVIPQDIHVFIKVSTESHTWRFFAIYASTELHKRLSLWNELYSLSNSASIDWSLAGNFNEVLYSSENLGGNGINRTRAKHFWNCL